MEVLMIRTARNRHQTEGYILYKIGKTWNCIFTLELPWQYNQRRISCIPAGTYEVVRHESPKFGDCFWIQDVPDRSEILIHKGNFYKNTLGCILLGLGIADIDGDTYNDVTYSKNAMDRLLKSFPDGFTLTIKEVKDI